MVGAYGIQLVRATFPYADFKAELQLARVRTAEYGFYPHEASPLHARDSLLRFSPRNPRDRVVNSNFS
jgi:hypothetical protein